jgi:hypothetical protein
MCLVRRAVFRLRQEKPEILQQKMRGAGPQHTARSACRQALHYDPEPKGMAKTADRMGV